MRRVQPGDEASIHQLLCIPAVYRYLADGVEPPPAIARDWIGSAATDHSRSGGGLWVLSRPDSGKPAGLVRLATDAEAELELIYVLDPEYWGAGLATRMAHTAMGLAFSKGLVTTVWAGADVPNTASIRVMERLGMTFRRQVQYPAGAGVEYEIESQSFQGSRVAPLPVTEN